MTRALNKTQGRRPGRKSKRQPSRDPQYPIHEAGGVEALGGGRGRTYRPGSQLICQPLSVGDLLSLTAGMLDPATSPAYPGPT